MTHLKVIAKVNNIIYFTTMVYVIKIKNTFPVTIIKLKYYKSYITYMILVQFSNVDFSCENQNTVIKTVMQGKLHGMIIIINYTKYSLKYLRY